jgi:hypothetical protein
VRQVTLKESLNAMSGLEADRADEDTGRELPPTTIFIFTSDTKLTTPHKKKHQPRTKWLIESGHVFLLPPWADERSVVEKGTGRFIAVCFSPRVLLHIAYEREKRKVYN